MSGRLVLCATPIGNLGDASPRLASVLGEADLIYAEDTRRTAALLASLGVQTRVESYFVGNEASRSDQLASHLAAGKTVALVTDAGTPGVSDPGVSAVRAARRVGAAVSVVPGPSAVTAALAVSGFGADRFVFEGFLPRKKRDRRAAVERLRHEGRTIVLFVSPHRFLADLADLREALGPDREICVARELTKLHEEVWWGTLAEALEEWSEHPPRGEITVVVEGAPPAPPDRAAAWERARALVSQGMSPSEAARIAASETGASRREIYRRLTTPTESDS